MAHNKDDKQDLLRPIEADGIQEFDNQMPRWWVALFYITVIVGTIYGIKLHYFGGETLIEAYNASGGVSPTAVATLEETSVQDAPGEDDGNLADRLASKEYIDGGKKVYATNCSPCHGADGGGVIGPNLTDNYFIHGRSPEETVKVISEGVPAKGMVAWKPVIGKKQVDQVAAFVLSLIGTTPASAKEPQGELIEK